MPAWAGAVYLWGGIPSAAAVCYDPMGAMGIFGLHTLTPQHEEESHVFRHEKTD
jgi:hypothetical protein